MKYYSFILTVICFLSTGFTYSPSDINFSNKSLQRTLKKSGLSFDNDIKELVLKAYPNLNEHVKGKFFKVMKKNESQYAYLYIGRVNSCRAGGCAQSVDEFKDVGSEYFDYFIFWDSIKTVKLVKVYNYQATHGQEITAKGWLKQFIGFVDGDALEVDKNIDAISGATISVYAITDDIQAKTRLLKSL